MKKKYNTEILQGAGGLYSSITDMQKWAIEIKNPTLIPAKLFNKIFETNNFNYDFGWGIYSKYDQKILQHLGSMPGVGSSSCIQIYTKSKGVVSLLSNYGLPNTNKICDNIAAIFHDQLIEFPKEKPEIKYPKEILKQLEGKYNGFLNFEISSISNDLCIDFDFGDDLNRIQYLYYPVGENIFQNRIKDEQIQFQISDEGISLWGIYKSRK